MINIKKLINLYITCRFNKENKEKINKNYKQDLNALGYTGIKHYLKDNSDFFCFEDVENKYFVFIGSNEFKDWLYNFFFFQREIPYESSGTNPKIKVHSGFFEMYLKIRDSALKEAKATNKKLVLIGHSLGSALATLAAVDFQYNFKVDVISFITGTPKVGNKYFKKSYNNRVPNTLRIVKGVDIVSHLPPSLFGFRHVSNDYLHLKSWNWFSPIKDHDIRDYENFI